MDPYAVYGRVPWRGGGEPDPNVRPGKYYPDICPPNFYPVSAGAAPPPVERKSDPCPPLDPKTEHYICRLAREIGKEAANYVLSPYQFPTPWSQDFDVIGSNTVTAIAPAIFRLALFKVPPAHVGVLNRICLDIPPALQPFTTIRPTINGAVMKSFTTQTFVGAGQVAPTEAPGVLGVPGVLPDLFHPLQEEMQVGVEVQVAAGGAPSLPAVMRACLSGRYWAPGISTKFHNYLKQD